MTWTTERIDHLRRLCETTALSAQQIADDLGIPHGRCHVIGKCRRLGIKLPKGGSDRPPPPQVSRVRARTRPSAPRRIPIGPIITLFAAMPPYLSQETRAGRETAWYVRIDHGRRFRIYGEIGSVEFTLNYETAVAIAKSEVGKPMPPKAHTHHISSPTTPKPDPFQEPVMLETVDPIDIVFGAGPAHMALRSNHCRWPNGDPAGDEFSFCCAPKDATESYCGFHRKLAGGGTQSHARIRPVKLMGGAWA